MILPLISFEANLVADPELRTTTSGIIIASMRVAITESKRDASGTWQDGETTYLKLNVFKKQAENAIESLRKGDTVIVIGRFRNKQWEDKDGTKRYAPEVDVDSIGLSLRWESFDKPTNKKDSGSQWDSAPF